MTSSATFAAVECDHNLRFELSRKAQDLITDARNGHARLDERQAEVARMEAEAAILPEVLHAARQVLDAVTRCIGGKFTAGSVTEEHRRAIVELAEQLAAS